MADDKASATALMTPVTVPVGRPFARVRLLKLLKMGSFNHVGKRGNALGLADQLVNQHRDGGWDEALCTGAELAELRAENTKLWTQLAAQRSTPMRRRRGNLSAADLRGIVFARGYAQDLNDWEAGFVIDIRKRGSALTTPQRNKLDQIVDKIEQLNGQLRRTGSW